MGRVHGITKYGINSLMQIALAMDKELTKDNTMSLVAPRIIE